MHTLILLLLIFAHCIVYGSVEEEHPSLDPPPSIVVTLSCHFIGEEYILAANASALFSPGPGFASEFRRFRTYIYHVTTTQSERLDHMISERLSLFKLFPKVTGRKHARCGGGLMPRQEITISIPGLSFGVITPDGLVLPSVLLSAIGV